MRSFIAFLIVVICSPALYGQLADIYINVSGGYDIGFEVDEGFYVTVTAGGEIELIETEKTSGIDYGIDPRDPAGESLLWAINENPIEFYHAGNTDDESVFGKLRRAANAFFEYHSPLNTGFEPLHGKMKRAGYITIEYYTPENSECPHRWGKVRSIDATKFDYYCEEDEVSHTDQYGLLKSVDQEFFTYNIGRKGIGEKAETPPVRGKKIVRSGETRVHIIRSF